MPDRGDAETAHSQNLTLRMLRHARKPMVCLTASAVTGAGISLVIPTLSARAVDATLTGKGLLQAVIWLAAALLVGVLATYGQQVGSVYVTASSSTWLRSGLIQKALALGLPAQSAFPAGDLSTRVTAGSAEVAAVGPTAVVTITAAATSVGGLVGLWMLDWRLGATFLIGMPVATFLVRTFMRRATGLYQRYQELQSNIVTFLAEALAGIRTIRAAGTFSQETERVLQPVKDLSDIGRRQWKFQAGLAWQAGLLLPLLQVAVLAVAGHGVVSGRLSPGSMVAAVAYVTLALGAFEQIDALAELAHIKASARRIEELISHTPTGRGAGQATLPSGRGEIQLRAVTVRREGTAVLDDISFTVPAGALVALVGPAGSGKSTLAAVAGGLIPPDQGHVVLDGIPFNDLKQSTRHRAVAFAFDRPHLLGNTVEEALQFGCPEASLSQVRQAARASQSEAFIRRLPSGFHTKIADLALSGGELQRLGLARAFAQDARILIFDDALSSLDTMTEALVTRALTEEFAGRTRIVVSRRLVTAARADFVIWLDRGWLRGFAHHTHLWPNPDYRAVYGHSGTEDESRETTI
ncbi:ABC transporter ATP-binding protein [Streptomyces chartreusis]|uniref:ABC transporter ATP-binding protein n=1 Tax=Streptomyces chartreusis TaxID=1969 RepID=UPI003699C56D